MAILKKDLIVNLTKSYQWKIVVKDRKVSRYITDDAEVSSDEQHPDEENSDNEDSDEENYSEE